MGPDNPPEVGASVKALARRLRLPTGLAEVSVTRTMFPDIIKGALQDPSDKTNPRIASGNDYPMMVEASL
jgi:4-hydroxybutyrate dehydrogenase